MSSEFGALGLGDLAETLPSETLDGIAPAGQSVNGVPLPDHFRDDVIRSRPADLLNAA